MANESRLYRQLPEIPKPIFALQTPNIGTITDEEIQSVVINRGKSNNAGGVNPSTLEVSLANNKVAKAGDNVGIVIRTVAATAIAARFTTDPDTPAYIRDRFQGRVGMQQMEDTGALPTNTIYAASWSAQLSYSPDVHTVPSGTSMQTLLTRLCSPAYLSNRFTVTPLGTYDTTFGDSTGTYSDNIGKYAGDIGILIRDTRAGNLEILPMPYRRDRALAGTATSSPLTRSQAISPAQWTQPNELPATEYKLTYRDTDNVVKTIVTSSTGAVTGTAPVEEVDWTYFRALTDQWRYIHGLRATGFDNRFRLEEVKVDLLHLLNSPYPYHWEQAGYLLKMQVGDPIYLGLDWPTALRGAHFAEGIKEEITPDSWSLTLNLVRFREIAGIEPTETIPARVWDQAPYPWDSETNTWDGT